MAYSGGSSGSISNLHIVATPNTVLLVFTAMQLESQSYTCVNHKLSGP